MIKQSLIERAGEAVDPTVIFGVRWTEVNIFTARIITSSLIFYLILFLTVPIAIQLTYQVVCDNVVGRDATTEQCDSSEVSSQASRVLLLVNLANNVPAFLVSGFYASFADRYGRKRTLLVPTAGYIVYIGTLLYFAIRRTTGNRLVSMTELYTFTVVALFLLGMSGSFSAYQLALFSFSADVTSTKPSRRDVQYSLLEASLFFSKTVGPLITGVYAQREGFTGPLCLSLGMCVACFLFNVFFLPEYYPAKYPDLNSPLVFEPFKTVRNMGLLFKAELWTSGSDNMGDVNGEPRYSVLRGSETEKHSTPETVVAPDEKRATDEKMRYYSAAGPMHSPAYHSSGQPSPVPYTALAFFLHSLTYFGNGDIIILFVKYQFDWGPELIGIYEAADALVACLGMLVLPYALNLLLKNYGGYVNEHWLLVAYLARTVHYSLFGVSPSTEFTFAILPMLFFAAIVSPRSRSIISNSVPGDMQARIMSGFSAVQSLSTFMIPLMTLGYSYTVYTDPATMYFVFSGLCGLSALIFVFVVKYCRRIKCD